MDTPVSLVDIAEEPLKKAVQTIEKNLGRQVEKGTITDDARKNALGNIQTFTDLKVWCEPC